MAFAENYKPLSEVSGLSEKLQAAWARSDQLFGIVKRQAMLSKPIAFRHPFIFYVGHLPAFAWNQICAGVLKWTSPNPRFDEIFSRGIDPDVDSGSCHAHPEVPENWPSLDAVLRYRDQVRSAVLNSFDAVYASGSADVMAENGRVFTMVLEHEYMHQETLLYMIHALAEELKTRSREFRGYYFNEAAARKKITVPGGRAQLGASFDELAFGWDNEFPAVSIDVAEFAIDSVPVTNQEFFEFVLAGGYDQARFWEPADWLWRRDGGIRHPHFWLKQDGAWFYRTVFDLLPLQQVRLMAGLRQLGRSQGVCQLARRAASNRGRVSACRLRQSGKGRFDRPRLFPEDHEPKHRVSKLVAGTGGFLFREREFLGRARADRQRLGVDPERISRLSGFYSVYDPLSGILRGFFRRQALRAERRVLGHRCRSGPTQFPQLVSSPLSLCVCQVSLR